jgi:hypothetical protein
MVPQDIRERKGSFFTPQQWVELSQKYIGDVLGEDWQDEYYIWDCAAGTGNLLAGLTNKYNIWASTLDKADVDVIHDRIKNGANLLENHVFQFDFLNDDFSKLPKGLQDIINSDKKRKKLVVYINPPYAEGGSSKQMTGTAEYKKDVEKNKVHDKYIKQLAGANREIFAQFLIRIYNEIPNCKTANFSKLKNLQGPHFDMFRKSFTAKLEKIFLCPANTFDNVKGQFPIGFFIWDLNKNEEFESILADVYNADAVNIGNKSISSYKNSEYFSKWVNKIKIKSGTQIGWLEGATRNDFQHNNIIFIINNKEQMAISRGMGIFPKNLIECCICFSVRKVIVADWLNDRDLFLYPNDNWKNDTDFQNDCLTFTVFNTNIQSKYGTNHWIPFTEEEVNAKNNFESHFMIDFIKDKTIHDESMELFEELTEKHKPLKFSGEAKAVFKAGKKLWQYYHSQLTANVNASLYDIREFFQGRDDNGKMNNTSGDDTYNKLIGDLRSALKTLALKIQPKVYEYGFLVE